MKFKECLLCVFILGIASLTSQTQDQPAGASSRGVKPIGVKPVDKFVETRQPTPPPATRRVALPANNRRLPPTTPIGLGLTIYRQSLNGEWISIAPTQAFRTSDKIRFLIETNRDGYLYLFNVTNQGSPVMIFPAGDLHQGANTVKAHVPYEIPNQKASQPWLEFTGPAAAERMYILFARRPLPGVLHDQALVAYCQKKQQRNEECIWEPSRSEWARLVAHAEGELVGTADSTIGQAQSATLREAVSRGIRHPANAPVPTLVKLRASSQAKKVMLSVELTHK